MICNKAWMVWFYQCPAVTMARCQRNRHWSTQWTCQRSVSLESLNSELDPRATGGGMLTFRRYYHDSGCCRRTDSTRPSKANARGDRQCPGPGHRIGGLGLRAESDVTSHGGFPFPSPGESESGRGLSAAAAARVTVSSSSWSCHRRTNSLSTVPPCGSRWPVASSSSVTQARPVSCSWLGPAPAFRGWIMSPWRSDTVTVTGKFNGAFTVTVTTVGPDPDSRADSDNLNLTHEVSHNLKPKVLQWVLAVTVIIDSESCPSRYPFPFTNVAAG